MNTSPSNSLNLLKVFNYLGAALVFFGIAFFISANWFSLNPFLKIFTTLGSAITAYLLGVFLFLERKHEAAGAAFFMVSALLLPLGLYVTTDQLMVINHVDRVSAVIFTACFLVFFISHCLRPRALFLFFSILFATSFYLSFVSLFLNQSIWYYAQLWDYLFLALGLSYLFLGRYLAIADRSPLIGPLYFFGLFLVLSASYSLGGHFAFRGGISELWKIITALLILASFLLSVPLKSKSFLYVGALFLVIYLIDLSTRFFEVFGTYGWPLMLIMIGFLLMFTGYLVVNLHKKINRGKNQ